MAQVTNTESFETAVPPTGWSSAIGSGSYNWARATTTGLPNGSYYAFYDSYHAVAGNYASMASSAFDLSSRGSNTPTVSFYFYRGTNYIDNPDYLEVYINTTSSLSGATILSTGTDTRLYRHYALAPVAAASGWVQYTFTIPAGFNGTSNYIIFKAVSGWGDILDIDQVQIVAYPCVIPTITSTTPASGVGPNTYTLGATASQGTVNWYTAASGGSVIATGTSYTTPNISVTTTYYVNATYNVCASSPRVAIVATVASHYNAGTGITISGTTITNTAPDQTLTLTTGTGISVTGTYPNFNISNTTPDQTVTLTGNGATSVSGTYPNFTISSSDNNTTYNAGTGIDISNGSITNTAPDQTVTLTGNGATSVTGSYPNFTISSTDNNTNYNAGTGLSLSGNTFNSVWTADGNNIVNNNTGTVSINSLGSSGSSLVKADNSGLLDKISMSGDNTQVLRADGTFGPIVYPPSSYRISTNTFQVNQTIEVGNSVVIGGVNDSDPNSINQIYTDDAVSPNSNTADLYIQSKPGIPQHNTIINKEPGGKVGIGTDPLYKLDLNGTLRIKGIGEGLGKILTSNVDGLATWEEPLITTIGTGTGLYMDGNNAINSVWTNIDNKLYNNTAANVGIGTDNPITNLHLKGITDYAMVLPPHHHSAVFRIEDSFIHAPGPPLTTEDRNSWWDFIVSAQEKKFLLTSFDGTTEKEIIYIKETGQVGIGVEEPTESLEINGNIKIINDQKGEGKILTSDANGLGTWRNDKWQQYTGSNNIFKLNGNVSLGDDDPHEKLEVYGKIKMVDNNQGLGKVLTSDENGIATWQTPATYSAGTGLNITGNTINSVWTKIADDIFSNTTGNIGIGINNPGTKLTISNGISDDLIHLNQSDDSKSAKIAFSIGSYNSSNLPAARIGTEPKGKNSLIFETNFNNDLTEKMRISPKGLIGIGTSNPTEKLEIYNGNLLINNDQASILSSNVSLIFGGKDNGNFNKAFYFRPDPSPTNANYATLQLDRSNTSGVFEPVVYFTSQENKESFVKGKFVAGEIEARDVSSISIPDYVFAPDYKVMSLEETESFVTNNCHLPEVPSAIEFEENGINFTKMSILLLKKIEELTLYSIEQNKKIKELQDEISKMKNQK